MARAWLGVVGVVIVAGFVTGACLQSEALAQDVFDHETPVPGFK
jgi:hypothetical protein